MCGMSCILVEWGEMSVAVRRAVPCDAIALHELAAATFELACPPGTRPEDIAAFIRTHLSSQRFTEYLGEASRELLVAVDGAQLVGYTMLVFGDPSDADVAASVTLRPTVELSKVYVVAEQHGTGTASALISATVGVAEKRGVASIWLGVNQYNDRANGFYEKHGFVCVGVKQFLVGTEWHDDFVRELALR